LPDDGLDGFFVLDLVYALATCEPPNPRRQGATWPDLRSPLLVLALCATPLLLAGCSTGPGYDPNGPRNFEGLLVDPRTGITLPGQG